jgi:hypothetical protein
MRVQLRRQLLEDGSVMWRLCEADGELVVRWLPLEPFTGALDRGGFPGYLDARAFALGVDWIRAEAGILGDLDARAIDNERLELDADRQGRRPAPLPLGPLFEAA